ncbi:MAG: glycerate kinase [Clostridia bacterium]|nr:glycerate kinase [Clostridia bacterium]
MRNHAKYIYENAIRENLPDSAVKKALENMPSYSGRLILVAIGKASYQMAKTAVECLGNRIDQGIVITKYGHSEGALQKIEICEASHPVLDENTVLSTRKALKLTEKLTKDDLVLFLVSGGGSALFEDISCSLSEMQQLTSALLKCGASIEEINTVRKHISNVKGGKFAQHCAPATVYAVVLSDVIGDRLDMIASGPACADLTTVSDTLAILEKYNIEVNENMLNLIKRETPKKIDNAIHNISGSVTELCKSAKRYAEKLGYKAEILRDNEQDEAKNVGFALGRLAIMNQNTDTPLAFIVGGETVVNVKGNGKGGRNQEIALSASIEIKELDNMCVFSVGSDGTDGPTDAAGGYADGNTYKEIAKSKKSAEEYLNNNDAYNALALSDGLIFTGPTGTNVNDVSILLINARSANHGEANS